jgi:ABC-type multidrug transport system ATPase subunit
MLLLGISVAFQLTRGKSILEGIWGGLTGKIASAELMFETVAFLVVGILLPMLVTGWISRKIKNSTSLGEFAKSWGRNFGEYILFTVAVLPIIYNFTQTHLDGGKIIGFIVIGVLIIFASFGVLIRFGDTRRGRLGFFAIQAFGYIMLILLLDYSLGATINFLVPLAIVVILCAAFAEVFAILADIVFQNWNIVVAVLRVMWGVAWRVGLVWVAFQIGGQVYQISQMSIVTAMLQSTPDSTNFQEVTGKNGIKDDPLAKGSFAYYREVDIPWGNLKSQGSDFDNQVNLLLTEIDTTFQEPQTFESVGTQYTSRAQTTHWSGLNPVWRSAVYDTPPLVEEITVALFMLLFAFLGIRSWRGWSLFPTVLNIFDLVILSVIGVFYLIVLFNLPDHLSDIWRLVFVLVGLVVIGGTIYWTYQQRLVHREKILSVFPLDIAIDAAASSTYVVASVRNTQEAAERVRHLSRQYGLEVDPDAIIEKLPVGSQQRVEIVKALYRKADILILDEPTAVLTPQEGKELFRIMRDLAAQGVSIIFITHKLKEVFEVANRIVVMRGGAVVGEAIPSESTESSLAELMVGREVLLQVEKDEAQPAEPVLEVHHLEATDDRGSVAVKGVSFEVRAGEVLGIAGVQGNGQSELVEVLTGLRHLNKGSVYVMGEELRPEVSANADPWRRLGALLLDSGLIALFALVIYGMYTYFAPGKGTLSAGLNIFILTDAIATLLCWQVWRRSFGKSAMQIDIEAPEDSVQLWGIYFNLIIRYALQIAIRVPLIYAGLIFASALHNTPFHDIHNFGDVFTEIARLFKYLGEHGFILPTLIGLITHGATFFQIQSDPNHQAWYDKLIKARVVKHAEISPRRIKNMYVSHVPEDRLRFGLVKPFSIAENLILNDYYEPPYAEAPNKQQAIPLIGVYASIGAVIFFILATLWDSLWLDLWHKILDAYDVPSLYSTVPTTRALTGTWGFYLNNPC